MKVDFAALAVNSSVHSTQNTESVDSKAEQILAIDHYSPLPLDMHRKVLGHTTDRSLNRMKAVNHFFHARVEDPIVQTGCAIRFAHRYAPLERWAFMLQTAVNARHELIPSDALLAARQCNLSILNPANFTIVPGEPSWYARSCNAVIMRGTRAVGYVELRPSKHSDPMRLIGLNNRKGQIVGFARLGSIYRNHCIDTYLPSPAGLLKAPKLLAELREQNLNVGSEYFIVFKTRNSKSEPSALLEVPPELENSRTNLEIKLACSDDDDSVDTET